MNTWIQEVRTCKDELQRQSMLVSTLESEALKVSQLQQELRIFFILNWIMYISFKIFKLKRWHYLYLFICFCLKSIISLAKKKIIVTCILFYSFNYFLWHEIVFCFKYRTETIYCNKIVQNAINNNNKLKTYAYVT